MMAKITLAHGSGGRLTHELVERVIYKRFGNPMLKGLPDSATFGVKNAARLAFTTDSFVVNPVIFKGGDIGKLAVCGTINDLAVSGALPLYLSCSLIIEEGLDERLLVRIIDSMAKESESAGVSIVTGDTKVVEKGSLGGCVMNVSGIGKRTSALESNLEVVKQHRKGFAARWLLDSNISVGDKIIVSGTLGDHGLAVLSAQQGLTFGSEIKSDVKPLNKLIYRMLGEVGGAVTIKDATRGGLADAINELSEKSKVGILIHETKVPIREDVRVASEMLGLDPLEIGNEGKIVIGVVPAKAEQSLNWLKQTAEGKDAEIIGEATSEFKGVAMQTAVGGKRIIARPVGDPVPRIC